MTVQPWHDMTATDVDWIEDRLYEHNKAAVGRADGEGLGFVARDEAGAIIGITAGYTWAGVSEIKQMWVDAAHRGRGLGRALLDAMVAEADRRGVERIWVSSYDFQAPGLYEKAGFTRMAEFDGWPPGHVNVVLCKTLREGR
jgi:ribosomal protein S18 acetylase RimI-like enzyme